MKKQKTTEIHPANCVQRVIPKLVSPRRDGADRGSSPTDMFWKAKIAWSSKKVFVDTTGRNLASVSMIDTWPLRLRDYKAGHLSH